jgi:hypothetical protein
MTINGDKKHDHPLDKDGFNFNTIYIPGMHYA